MVGKGPYTEFLKSRIDSDSLSKKKTEEPEPSSKSPDQPQESSTESMKDAAPEDHDVSFSSCNMPRSVCSWWPCGPSICSSYTYTGPPRHPNPGVWMILISVQISPSHSTLKNHSLKFRNHIDFDHVMSPATQIHLTPTCCASSVYCIWLVFWGSVMFYVSIIEWQKIMS